MADATDELIAPSKVVPTEESSVANRASSSASRTAAEAANDAAASVAPRSAALMTALICSGVGPADACFCARSFAAAEDRLARSVGDVTDDATGTDAIAAASTARSTADDRDTDVEPPPAMPLGGSALAVDPSVVGGGRASAGGGVARLLLLALAVSVTRGKRVDVAGDVGSVRGDGLRPALAAAAAVTAGCGGRAAVPLEPVPAASPPARGADGGRAASPPDGGTVGGRAVRVEGGSTTGGTAVTLLNRMCCGSTGGTSTAGPLGLRTPRWPDPLLPAPPPPLAA